MAAIDTNRIVKADLKRIYDGLSERERDCMRNSTFLFTGAAGFLGFYMVQFLVKYREELKIRKIICLDNFKVGCPVWLTELAAAGLVTLYEFDISKDCLEDIPEADGADYVFHMASIASPTYYRKYPLETLEANVWGLRSVLDHYRNGHLKGLAFFSSSEIYGDPDPANIPTREDYRGFVDCQGPRACYDEAKRFGETLCYCYHLKYELPIVLIRPFNNFGPGMKLNDARVPADFARAVLEHQDITILSDGKPTRTFCYISDSVTGYYKCILHACEGFETYNIGSDGPEISVRQLADIYAEASKKLFDFPVNVNSGVSADKEYLTNNPNRRCPDIGKARKRLGYAPKVEVRNGVEYYLSYLAEEQKDGVKKTEEP